jgi:hypothetical protein
MSTIIHIIVILLCVAFIVFLLWYYNIMSEYNRLKLLYNDAYMCNATEIINMIDLYDCGNARIAIYPETCCVAIKKYYNNSYTMTTLFPATYKDYKRVNAYFKQRTERNKSEDLSNLIMDVVNSCTSDALAESDYRSMIYSISNSLECWAQTYIRYNHVQPQSVTLVINELIMLLCDDDMVYRRRIVDTLEGVVERIERTYTNE